MFSKAKRFDQFAKTQAKEAKKLETDVLKLKCNNATATPLAQKSKPLPSSASVSKCNKKLDTQSLCGSTRSVKSYLTPKPQKITTIAKAPSSLRKPIFSTSKNGERKFGTNEKVSDDIIKSQEVEIRNKDYTISEYSNMIEELKNEIASLQRKIKAENGDNNKDCVNDLNKKNCGIKISESDKETDRYDFEVNSNLINDFKMKISSLEEQCEMLEKEVSNKQVELSSVEQVICIRDSLCKDLQEKLTNMETCLEETKQRLEMVKGHHALALEANESIRREYKVELETMKIKLEEEKQSIITKCKVDQESLKSKYNGMMESIKKLLLKEKEDAVYELKKQIISKDNEMKAKLEQIEEASHEKLKLCEIQFEERYQTIQEHWTLQEDKIQSLEKEAYDLKNSCIIAEDQIALLQKELKNVNDQNESLISEKFSLVKEVEDMREESKKKLIDFENQINKLMVEVDKAVKEKKKFETSLFVTRDIVQVLTMRLRESDDEVEHLEGKLQTINEEKETLKDELSNYKSTLNNTTLECNEYKEALVNILQSKTVLAKEHNRIMEHNVTLIESLKNIEKEAYRELGTIKNELIEDVEMLKMESSTQIKLLHDEVEKKRVLCEIATEHATCASAVAEQARGMLARAAAEITRLEGDTQRLNKQIQDQQSLVVELSLLRQENEELAMTVAKQSSIIEMMKKDMEQRQSVPKSPSVVRKNHKLGKENNQIIVSPLRERNH